MLCIDQSNTRERREEIAKQGAIFANAKAGFTYLWSIPSGNELVGALQYIGNLLLRSLKFSDPAVSELDDEAAANQLVMAERLRSDPWFSSLWTLQETIICPSSVWLTNDGNFCKVNSKIVTTAFFAAACYVLVETIVMRFVILASLDSETDEEREASEKTLLRRIDPWRDWAERDSSIVCALSASRPAILLAAAKRVATRRRGEAVLAAMKIADNENVLGEDSNLLPGGLPIGLVNKVLEAEGRIIFDANHENDEGLDFFADILPTTADSCTERSGMGDFIGLPAKDWQIRDLGFLHIPEGSIMQKFSKFGLSRVRISLQCFTRKEPTEETISMHAKGYVQARYKSWRALHGATRMNDKFPEAIRIKFLPLAVRRAMPRAPHDEEFPASFGLILASSFDSRKTDVSSIWYKCGDFVAYSYKTYKLNWKYGILIGSAPKRD